MVSEAWVAAYDCGCTGAAGVAQGEVAEAAPAEPPAYEKPPSYSSESPSVSNTSLAAPAVDPVFLTLTPSSPLTLGCVCNYAPSTH